MLILAVILLTLIPAIAIVYPFLWGNSSEERLVDEPSPSEELGRRWEAAVAGLRNTELERALGNLPQSDYEWLREEYMTEAALVMKALELEHQQEEEMLAAIEAEIGRVREQVIGSSQEPSTDAAQ